MSFENRLRFDKVTATSLVVSLYFFAVNEFWKSVKIWQSYCHEFGGLLFLENIVHCTAL